jgi:hypothetical protein
VQRVGQVISGMVGILVVICLFSALEQPAHAYADPGSGLLLFQVGSSMVAGALFFLRTRIRKLFRLGRNTSEENAAKQP